MTVGDLSARVGGKATVNAAGGVDVTAPETVINGALRVKGPTMLKGGAGGASTVITGPALASA